MVLASVALGAYALWALRTKYRNLIDQQNRLYAAAKQKADAYDKIVDLENRLPNLSQEVERKTANLDALNTSVDLRQHHLDLQEGGFFKYKFKFEDLEQYSRTLEQIRDAQRLLVKKGGTYFTTVKNLEDSPVIESIGKLGLRAFNADAELVANRASATNYESCLNRLRSSFETINKLMSPLSTQLHEDILKLNIAELEVAIEHAKEQARIEEEQAEIKRRMAEEEREREEAEKAIEKSIDEEMKYEAEIDLIRKQLESETAIETEGYQERIVALEKKLAEAQANTARATSNAEITRQGHIYIISNIGSFGENVFKIGMTRRSEPTERVAELSNASVPFRFDIHAMIPTEDAPSLETALHQAFESRRLNQVNSRKEFFRVSLDEIKETCDKIGVQIKMTRLAQASEYRETQEMMKKAT